MDCFSAEKRSAIMRRIGQKDTRPEILLRKALWARGLRYRKHVRMGRMRPELMFARAKIMAFIDGCFWHGCPKHYTEPASNASFWREKIQRNQQRDKMANQALEADGWTVIRVWQCEVYKELEKVVARVIDTVMGTK